MRKTTTDFCCLNIWKTSTSNTKENSLHFFLSRMDVHNTLLIPIILLSCSLLPVLDSVIAQKLVLPHYAPLNISSDLSDKAALDVLLSKERYDRRLLPPSPKQLSVNVSVLLLTLASPDESSLKYEVGFLMQFVWIDPRLQFNIYNSTQSPPKYSPDIHEAMPIRNNPRRRPYLDALHHWGRVWLPDVYYVKHGDFRPNLDPANLALRIYLNGTVNFTTRRHLILSCQGNLGIFPFDDPVCSFSIESISHERDFLEFQWQTRTGVLRKSPNLTFLNAYLSHNETKACNASHWRGDYSCLQVELTFNRDRAFYFTTVFIPDIILVTSSFITFWLEWNAVPARVMLGVTTMLNFFVSSNGFRSTLPVVSNLTAMNIWDGFSMFFIYGSLLEFVFVNYIGRKRPRRPPELTTAPHNASTQQLNAKIEGNQQATTPLGLGPSSNANRPTDIITCTSCSPTSHPCTHSANNGCPAAQRPRLRIIENPIRVAKTVDVASRIIFPVAYTAFLIYFFISFKAFI